MRHFLILILSLMLTSCYYDSKEYLFPQIDTTCDTANISFTGTIKPLLTTYCYSCHSNTNAASEANGIALENYADVKLAVDDGSLLGSISHDAGYSPMPLGGGSLDDCSIELFRVWIGNGSPEN
jgi:hypothetical protein